MVILPFPAAPDENRHFLKIFSITEGYIMPSDETILPDGLDIPDQYDLKYDELRSHYDTKADYKNRRFYDLSRTALYFPLVYTPQTIGIMSAKLVTNKIYTIAFIGRLFGYIFNVCMIVLAMYLIPYGEKIIFLSVLNPMYMQQAVSLSGDSVVNSIAVLITAYIFALRKGRVKKIWILYVIFPILAICKMFYLPMVFMVFLLANTVFKNKKRAIAIKAFLIIETFILSGLWAYLGTRVTLYIADEKTGSNLERIIGSPLNYGIIMMRTMMFHGRTWIRQIFGGNLGWISVNIFMPFILIYILVFIYTSFTETSDIGFQDRLHIALIDLIIFIIVLTTEYVQWTFYGADIIDGVQGRYFLPLVPLSFIALTGENRVKLPSKYLDQIVYGYAAVYNLAALITVYAAFSK